MTRPLTGMRLTCTSIGERNTLTCCQFPGGVASPVGGPATITRPSAGESTALGGASWLRSGSRKKKRRKHDKTNRGRPKRGPVSSQTKVVKTAAPRMNGQPAGSIRISGVRLQPDANGLKTKTGSSFPQVAQETNPGFFGGSGGSQMSLGVLERHLLHLIFEG